MKYIQNLKIRHKLLVLIGVNIFFFALAGMFSYQALALLGDSQQRLIINTTLLYHQMNADMMHDALRADVYKALSIHPTDQKAKDELLDEFGAHKEIFFESLQHLSQFSINDTIDEAVIQVMPALQAYSQQSEKIIGMTFQTNAADAGLLPGELRAFTRVFDDLADKMSVLSSLIASNSEAEQAQAHTLVWLNKLLISCLIVICMYCIWQISKRIARQLTEPVIQAREAMLQLSQGNLPEVPDQQHSDELSEMMQGLQILTHNLADIKGFAQEVGQGRFESEITVFHNSGELGTALVTMCKSLQSIAEKEQNQKWINAGLTEAQQILRIRTQSLDFTLDQVLQFTMRYLHACQGCLSLLQDENPSDRHLRIHACYAFERKKYLHSRLELDEGLPCRVLQEGNLLYFTEIPANYIRITSGLGTVPPQSLLVLPLKIDDAIIGVLEMAFIRTLPAYYIDFADKLSAMLAQHISTDIKNTQTAQLLTITQQQKADIQAQEEEVRQNMEELYAIQEEQRRREHLYLERIAELEMQLSPALATSNELHPYKLT